MDSISPITTVTTAPVAAVRAVARVALPGLAERMAQVDGLAATVLDGKAGEDQRLAAYQDLQAMEASGQLIGAEGERRRLFDQAAFESDIGQRAQQLSSNFIRSVNEAGRSGGPAGALKAAGAAFDGLPSADQKILFATTLNAPDRLGGRPYGDMAAWRANTEAQSRMVDYMQAAGVVGANGRLDYGAAARSDDPKLAEAVKLSQRRDNNSADWTRSVLQLFGAARAPDRLDLSPAARKLVDAAPAPAQAAPQPAPYRAGALVSTRA